MKLLIRLAVVAATLGSAGAALAQPPHPVMHQRTVVTTHTTTTTRHGPRFRGPRCHTEWRHHHRVRVCR